MYWTTLEISAPRCALMCYPSSNITYCIACLLCIGVILLNKFNSIHLTNTLNWTTQTKAASSKAQQTLGVIRRNLNKCPTHIKAVAYTSLVRPILEYASAAWDPHSQHNIKSLERIQRQARQHDFAKMIIPGNQDLLQNFYKK